MRIQIYLLIALSFCVLSCNSEKDKKETKSIQSTKKETANSSENSNHLLNLYQQEVLETILDKLKADGKLNKTKEGFIVREQIGFSGTKFNYLKLTIPEFEFLRIQSDDECISISQLTPKSKKQIVLDTITITGQVNLSDYIDKESMQLLFSGIWTLKANVYQEYEPMSKREFTDAIHFEQNIDLTSSKTYSKEDFYLKARVIELKASDLTDFSKEELSYLRNEIFARYGHIFKTDKMKNYFNEKSWYIPVFNDATELLNEIEKKMFSLLNNWNPSSSILLFFICVVASCAKHNDQNKQKRVTTPKSFGDIQVQMDTFPIMSPERLEMTRNYALENYDINDYRYKIQK